MKSYFSTKDLTPSTFNFILLIVYFLLCWTYHTRMHYNTRVNQHLGTDDNTECNRQLVEMLDTTKSLYEFALNEHVKCVSLI